MMEGGIAVLVLREKVFDHGWRGQSLRKEILHVCEAR